MVHPAKIQKIVASIRESGARPELVESLIQTLSAYIKRFPNPPGRTVAAEQEFFIRLKDPRRGRPFYLVGKRDWEGEDKDGLFLGEFKTHRGPWVRGQSIQNMLDGTLVSGADAKEPGYWEGWLTSWQAAVYLFAMGVTASLKSGELDSEAMDGLTKTLPVPIRRFLVRVAIKPGPNNQADAFERMFTYSVEQHQSLLNSFFHTVSQIMDDQESGVFPSRVNLLGPGPCVNKYRKVCRFLLDCQGKQTSRIIQPHVSHLDVVREGRLPEPLPWFDVSSVSQYAICPELYRQTYVNGHGESSDALVEGGLFHNALEILHEPDENA